MKKFQHLIEYIILKIFIFTLNLIPIFLVYLKSKVIGLFVYYFIPIRQKSAISNIKKAFPRKSLKETKQIIKTMTQNFILFMFESAMMHRLRKKLDKYTEFEGLEFLEDAYKEKKGVVLYTAHIGNWHIMGQVLVDKGYPINNIVKRQRNELVFNEELKAMNRVGMKVTILQKTPKNILKALKDGDVVEFLGDQDAGENGVFVPFFNEDASTAVGPALFHLKTGAPLIFAVDIRTTKLNHKVYIEKINYTPTGDLSKDIESITLLLNQKLESYITKYPDQYFWLHHRWWTKKLKVCNHMSS